MYCMYYHPEEGNNNSLTLTLTSDSEADKTSLHPLNSFGSQMAFSHCESTHLQAEPSVKAE